ncbi:MAG TPA: PDZ domain-containing protein, partial [Gemmataceae bacterium]|nr:PDZ domain-containing protein [Gemmataceae bacterium]
APDSPADKARLQVDYVITRVNGKPVNTPDEFYAAIPPAAGAVELTVANLENHEDKVTLNLK